MTWLWTVLSALASIAKAVLAGLAFKKDQDAKSAAEHDKQALTRHETNRSAIDDAVSNGVRNTPATSTGSGPTPPAPPSV